jgi:1,4-dihydroxy-2-naphthoate octaprenyltransferase
MKNFILAMRPKTLVAGILPPLATYFYFISKSDERPLWILFLCILGALFIQCATNFFNDLIDSQKGADKVRIGPTRVTAAGLVNPKSILNWALLSLLLAVVVSIPLIMRGGSWIMIPGILSLYLSYGYTGGPYPLAYKGLGEVFVFIFFGLFSVLGSYYLFSLQFTKDVLILAVIYGLLTTTLICVNNLRDREQDKIVKKLTLATKMNHKKYRIFLLNLIFIPYLLIILIENKSIIPLLIPLFFAIKLSTIIIKEDGEKLNEGLKFSAIHLLMFGLITSYMFNS